MRRTRVAVVGCGAVARRAHIPALLAHPDVEIAALCDVDGDALDHVARRFGLRVPCHTSVEALLRDACPEVLDVCSPGATHVEIVRQGLEGGCHVLVEKPPALCAAEAEGLADLADARGRRLGTVLSSRYREEYLAVHAAHARGQLGRIVKIHAVHHGNLVMSESPALWCERTSKYLVYEFAIHLLDLMVDLCGPHTDVLFVNATRNPGLDGTTDLQLGVRFASGAMGLLDITADSTRHSSYFTHLHVYGTGMDAFVRYFPPSVRLAAGLQHPWEILVEEMRSFGSLVAKIVTRRYLAHRNRPHRLVIDRFVEWVRGGRPFPMTVRRALPTMHLLDAVALQIPGYAK